MRLHFGLFGLLLCLNLPPGIAFGADCADQVASPKPPSPADAKKRSSFDELVTFLRTRDARELLSLLDEPKPGFKLAFENKLGVKRDITVRTRRGKLQLLIRKIESKTLREFEQNAWSLTMALFQLGVADSVGQTNTLPAIGKTKGATRGPELWTELRLQRLLRLTTEAYRVVEGFHEIKPADVLADTDSIDLPSKTTAMYHDPLAKIRPNKADYRLLTPGGNADLLIQKLGERYRGPVLHRYQWRQFNRRLRFGAAVAATATLGAYVYRFETRDTIPSFSTFSPEYDRELMATPIPPATASTAEAEKFFRTVTQRFLSEEHRPLWPASNAPADTALLHNLCHKIYDMSVRFGDRSQIIRSSTLNQCTY